MTALTLSLLLGIAHAQEGEAPAALPNFIDLSGELQPFQLATEGEELDWFGLDLEGRELSGDRLLAIGRSRGFGVGPLGAGQEMAGVPNVIRLVGADGAASGVPIETTRQGRFYTVPVPLQTGETIRLAIGMSQGSHALVAALTTQRALDMRMAAESRIRALLFGAALLLAALLFSRGIVSRRGLYYSGFALAASVVLYIAVSAGWHEILVDRGDPKFSGARASALFLMVLLGVDFARRAMHLRELSPVPNQIAFGIVGSALILGGMSLIVPPLASLAGLVTVLVLGLTGVVVVEGTRQGVEGPKLLLGPWILFVIAALMTVIFAVFFGPRFEAIGALSIESLLVAGIVAMSLALDRIAAPILAVDGLKATSERESLRGPERRYRHALSGARKGVWDWRLKGDRLYLSASAMALLGFAAEGGEGSEDAFYGRVHAEDQPLYREKLRRYVDRGEGHFSHDMRVLFQDGKYHWMRLEAEVQGGRNPASMRIVGLLANVHAEYNKEPDLTDHDLNDTLTGLASRALFMERVRLAEQNAGEFGPPAVIVLNIDRFASINDGVGHAGGDSMLIILARRLEGIIAETDLAGRLGSDEFAVLVERRAELDRVVSLADSIREILSERIEVERQEIFPSLTLGVAVYDADDQDNPSVVANAETALFHGKAQGGNRVELFRHELAKRKGEIMALEAGLNRALERREVELLYQPILSAQDGRLAGFEALMRWNHPEYGLITPDKFIALAEETGAIVPLGLYVIEAGATQLKAWQNVYSRQEPIFVGVNLSARQILDNDLGADVERILEKTAVEPRSLIIEVTESVVMENPELAKQRLLGLATAGVGLALDDFGTGYSSLSHLSKFNFDKLKIDRAFIEDMETDEDTRVIVKAIIQLSRDLGQDVVAEGVQTESQLRKLTKMGCPHVQGYLFGKPMTAAEAERLIINDQNAFAARPAAPEPTPAPEPSEPIEVQVAELHEDEPHDSAADLSVPVEQDAFEQEPELDSPEDFESALEDAFAEEGYGDESPDEDFSGDHKNENSESNPTAQHSDPDGNEILMGAPHAVAGIGTSEAAFSAEATVEPEDHQLPEEGSKAPPIDDLFSDLDEPKTEEAVDEGEDARREGQAVPASPDN